jgi:Gas vesicle protein G
MFLIDDLLIGGLGFVFDKIATVVDQEMNDESSLHRTLMEAQMRLEEGEISDAEFATIEAEIIDRLRELRAAREGEETPSMTDEGVRITGVEISGPDEE